MLLNGYVQSHFQRGKNDDNNNNNNNNTLFYEGKLS